jgi:hypothetical protein
MKSNRLMLAAAAMMLTTNLCGPAVAQEAPSRGKVVNFSLIDDRGWHYELRRSEAQVVVLYFTSLTCPIARASMVKVQAIQEEFRAQGVEVWLINATPQEDPDAKRLDTIAQLALSGVLATMIPKDAANGEETLRRLKSLDQMKGLVSKELALGDRQEFRRQVLQSRVGYLPLLRDDHQAVTHHFGVSRTCEAIAIDTKNETIFYRGAIDDQAKPGAQKPQPTERYLHAALTEFFASKPIATPKTTPHGCLITFDDSWPEQKVTYVDDVAPVLQKRCVACHSEGKIGPFAFDSYESVKRWSAMTQEVLLDRRMPPWDADPHYGKFANDPTLTSSELHAVLTWIKQGCPRGEGDDPLTEVEPVATRWKLGEPDFVVPLPKRQQIPATGVLDYRYLDSDFAMPHDAWLRAAVCRAQNAKVVHHIIVRVRYPDGYKDIPSEAYMLSTWVPGVAEAEFPEGTGVFVPKGSRFNFEVHYTTTGEVETDQSELGLYLAKQPPKMQLEVRATETRDLEIPPGVANAPHSLMYCFRRDTMLYDLSPHMHLRGSWFKFQLLYPDGRRETALSVPKYDFNWQTNHAFAEPKQLPAGTWLICTGGFDNSARNPANPDPKRQVTWGLQTVDEMFMGFMTVAEPRTDK